MGAKPKITHEMEIGRKVSNFTFFLYDINFVSFDFQVLQLVTYRMRQFFWIVNYFWTVLLFTLITISICMSQTFSLGVKRINFIFPSQMQKGKWKPFYFFKARKRSEWSREIFILRSRLLPHFFHNCITLSKQTSVSKIFHPNWFKSQKTQYVKCCVKMHPTYFNSSYCIIERKVAFPLKYRKKMCCQK